MAGNDQKTEQATPRRLDKAREQGNFPVSGEIITAVTFLSALAMWSNSGAQLWQSLQEVVREGIRAAFLGDTNVWDAALHLVRPGLSLAQVFVKAGATVFAAALVVQLLQTGFGFAAVKLAPDLNRLNPLPRLAQLPQQNRNQLLRAVLLLPVVVWLVTGLIRENWPAVLLLPAGGMAGGLGKLAGLAQAALWRAATVLSLISLIDLAQRRRRYGEDLKMSRQEIRDESKETDGNTQAKAQIRRMMRDLLRRRMMSEVPRATAVIVNPTHYAVAIRYVVGESDAPRVLAKGKNYLALRIRQLAEHNGIPIVENPPLARSLYRAAEVGQEIPASLYRAVAEVLAYVYRMSRGGFQRGR